MDHMNQTATVAILHCEAWVHTVGNGQASCHALSLDVLAATRQCVLCETFKGHQGTICCQCAQSAVDMGERQPHLAPVQVQAWELLGRSENNARVGVPIYDQSCALLQRLQHSFPVNIATQAAECHNA